MKYFVVLLLLFSSFTAAAAALTPDQMAPDQMIRDVSDRVIGLIKQNVEVYKDHPEQLYGLVDEVVLPHFDFSAMTDLALGRYKKKVTSEQKSAIENEFRNLLVQTYGTALLQYNDETLVFLPMEGASGNGRVTVRTEINQAGGFPVSMNYKLRQGDDGWKVYDISVDEISLVTNYRSSFARAIKKNGVAGLIKTLRDKNQQ